MCCDVILLNMALNRYCDEICTRQESFFYYVGLYTFYAGARIVQSLQ